MATYQTERIFKAPVYRVYRAFTESAAYGKWNCGTLYDNIIVDLDAREGGVLHQRVRSRQDGSLWTFFGVYRHVETDKLLIYTFDWKQDWREESTPSLVELSFASDKESTRLSLSHTEIPEPAAASTESHWTNFLQSLDDFLA